MSILSNLSEFFISVYHQRRVLIKLVTRDFKSRYLSTYLGLPWAFIQPTVYIIVIWFGFTYGLKGADSTTSSGFPYLAWLIGGMIPWLFISQTMVVLCSSIMSYSYVIKKTNFPIVLIPLIKVLSGMMVHLLLLVIYIILLIFVYNIYPTIYWIQIIYYQLVLLFLLTGIGLLVSSLNIFVHDIAHIVNVIVTMLFWTTPILWKYSMLEGNYRYIALLNPFFYITEGYRYTFLGRKWFFEYTEMNIFFWSVSISVFIIGVLTFRKLRPHFGDVL